MKTLLIVCLVILIVASLFAAYKWSKNTIEKMEDAPSGKPVARFFSMDGCPHCTNFDPEWTDFCGKKGVNGEKHTYYRSESGDKKNDEMVQKYVTKEDAVVSAFPTVLFIDENGKHTKYDGDRTADDLYKNWNEWIKDGDSKKA